MLITVLAVSFSSSVTFGAQNTSASGQTKKTADDYLQEMTLEEKAAQMFVLLPEQLTGVSRVTEAGTTTRDMIEKYPVGGLIYLKDNLVDQNQTKEMLSNTQKYSIERTGLPMFLCIDEEGGTVARISGRSDFGVPAIENMCDIGNRQDTQAAHLAGSTIGSGLSKLGFNVDFAPVADVLTNSKNTVVKKRSFGSDPELVTELCLETAKGLSENGILSCYKHFPGHGATSGDTHNGYAYTDKTLEDLMACELIPFKSAAQQKIPFVMTAHISLPAVTGGDEPASLSPSIVTGILKERLGYKGIIITDALAMGAVADKYDSAVAAVMAVKAGNDMLLNPKDFPSAYNAILSAVRSGEIPESRIDESVKKIIETKLGLMHTAD